uniref:Farnesoic acid O-methyl transferase domain-containing protein n=1 Tax=Megaselia scalaris TaxID=36166 RepID=T1H404_MEGSC
MLSRNISISIFIILPILFVLIIGGKFDDCRVVETLGTTKLLELNISKFENNAPKKDEFLRMKTYFKSEKPTFGVRNSGHKILFAEYRKSSKSAAIYKTHADYIKNEEFCVSKGDLNVFSEGQFVEIDFILEKTGLFTVIVNGDKGFIMSCNTGYTFDSSKETIIYLYYGGGRKDFILYDCPVC